MADSDQLRAIFAAEDAEGLNDIRHALCCMRNKVLINLNGK